ncbi:hypothetical protein [Rhodococcus opacus]|uniref:hypothetical protein n=1 Tax=Rhodococcus opacus TaxID=37919 RepID=UPI0037CACBBD
MSIDIRSGSGHPKPAFDGSTDDAKPPPSLSSIRYRHSDVAPVGAVGATTAQWIEALRSGSALPKSNLVQSAIEGRSAAAAVA